MFLKCNHGNFVSCPCGKGKAGVLLHRHIERRGAERTFSVHAKPAKTTPKEKSILEPDQ
jgi:hypothetical protein